uniref:Uncharacterized protein n=1 Tax=Pipistrellus kuhlii TaxID=59472 RepID=A0A7J7VBF2_PIPKU|nr:hypothetical protein mPipKuh1_008505 [Pipistrellus kuhlii]
MREWNQASRRSFYQHVLAFIRGAVGGALCILFVVQQGSLLAMCSPSWGLRPGKTGASVEKAHCHFSRVLLREKKALRKAYTVRQCFSGFQVDGRLKCRLWFNRSGVWLRFALVTDSQEILQLLSVNGDDGKGLALPQKSLEIVSKNSFILEERSIPFLYHVQMTHGRKTNDWCVSKIVLGKTQIWGGSSRSEVFAVGKDKGSKLLQKHSCSVKTPCALFTVLCVLSAWITTSINAVTLGAILPWCTVRKWAQRCGLTCPIPHSQSMQGWPWNPALVSTGLYCIEERCIATQHSFGKERGILLKTI